MTRIFSLVMAVVAFLAASGRGDSEWPQFRGARSLGTAEEAGYPSVWSETQNVRWKSDIPGRGWSSPIVWGDKIFVTTVVSEGPVEVAKKGLYFGGDRTKLPKDVHRWMVICLDFQTGKVLWEKIAHKGLPESLYHTKNSLASETPVTDGERVYAYFGNLGLFCYDLEGKELWSRKLGKFKMAFGWGTAASPVLHKDRIYVVNDNEEQSFLMALDKKTGATVWRVDRKEKSNWATPFVWENELRTEIITPGSGTVRSYDLDGKLLWELKGMSTITIATPFTACGLLYISSGYVLHGHRPVYAIKPGASGDISLAKDQTSNQYIAWYQKTGAPYNPTSLVYGDYFYVLKDRGFLSCSDARSGKVIYADQRLGAEAFTCSPWACDGKIFCLSEEGDTFVIQAGPVFKLLGKNILNDMCMATPALVRGDLIVRTESKVYRIGNDVKGARSKSNQQ
jgi:outer membrane protein assembly factor BamB